MIPKCLSFLGCGSMWVSGNRRVTRNEKIIYFWITLDHFAVFWYILDHSRSFWDFQRKPGTWGKQQRLTMVQFFWLGGFLNSSIFGRTIFSLNLQVLEVSPVDDADDGSPKWFSTFQTIHRWVSHPSSMAGRKADSSRMQTAGVTATVLDRCSVKMSG